MPKNQANHTETRREDWGTPKDLFAKLNAVFHFTVDLAATKENTLCPEYCSAEGGDNGFFDLTKDSFSGIDWCWCNPPYGADTERWVEKVAENVPRTVMLLPASPGTQWWHRTLWPRANTVTFIRGRLTFDGAPAPAQFDSVLITIGVAAWTGPKQDQALNELGALMMQWRTHP
jgi:phage N-6-adenine-methyltransferase